ncbi:2170_t:CDS:1, partial [Entrophospora sp. SA101]
EVGRENQAQAKRLTGKKNGRLLLSGVMESRKVLRPWKEK